MARPRQIDPALIQRAQDTAATATSLAVLRRCQAVLLPALFGATLEQTAAALGVGRASIARLQTAFRNDQNPTPPLHRNWDGRRRSLLSATEERGFLQPWLAQGRPGHPPSKKQTGSATGSAGGLEKNSLKCWQPC